MTGVMVDLLAEADGLVSIATLAKSGNNSTRILRSPSVSSPSNSNRPQPFEGQRKCDSARGIAVVRLPALRFSYLALVVMSPDNGMPSQTTPRPIASRKFKASILAPISANAACGLAASIETVS